ncbi:phage tail protein [Pseudomonas muyukensis]|uniref:Phage tail protein n=1 Tax=Pseudomonas muyukensis TaxID=2842357 RepID=A0ABX8M979_9PSED|nr:phage tail protein [Pseudomonas muyukensis]QXH34690.1 phage tail protein [Pseudomonas muyukensis]
MSRADDLAAIERGLLAVRGLNNAPIIANKVLTENDTGVVLVDASAGSLLIVLPAATKPMDIRVQRIDNSGNNLTVRAAGGESVKFHTHLRPAGYGHFVLLGAGDFWHLRSDGVGNWLLLDRFDNTPLGRIAFETTTATNPGGWGRPDARLLGRGDWPWLWDHAEQSGMLVNDAQRAGMEGGWTRGDGTSTFRIPELRGEFMRSLDEGRAVDPTRTPGSYQSASLVHGEIVDAVSSFRRMQNMKPKFFDVADTNETVAVSTTTASVTTQTIAANSVYFGAVRPRNIAYPSRIKLI